MNFLLNKIFPLFGVIIISITIIFAFGNLYNTLRLQHIGYVKSCSVSCQTHVKIGPMSSSVLYEMSFDCTDITQISSTNKFCERDEVNLIVSEKLNKAIPYEGRLSFINLFASEYYGIMFVVTLIIITIVLSVLIISSFNYSATYISLVVKQNKKKLKNAGVLSILKQVTEMLFLIILGLSAIFLSLLILRVAISLESTNVLFNGIIFIISTLIVFYSLPVLFYLYSESKSEDKNFFKVLRNIVGLLAVSKTLYGILNVGLQIMNYDLEPESVRELLLIIFETILG